MTVQTPIGTDTLDTIQAARLAGADNNPAFRELMRALTEIGQAPTRSEQNVSVMARKHTDGIG